MSESHPDDRGAAASSAEDARLPAPLSPTEEATTSDRSKGGSSTWASALAGLAATIAIVGILLTGFLWWQYRQFYVSLSGEDAETSVALQRVRAELRQVEDQLARVRDDVNASRSRDDALSARLDALPGRITELERTLSALRGVSFDARQQWLRAEATYYLSLANSELALAGRWDTAAAALEIADGRLRDLGDPGLNPVRALIADELLALRSARLPDLEGLNYSLSRLAARIDDLPLRGWVPAGTASRSGSVEAEPGLGRLWASLKAAIGSLIRVQRQAAPVERALGDADRALIRRQLGVELELARAALVLGHAESFRDSLASAGQLLRQHFDAGSVPVESALELIEGMRELEIAPPRPDISGSLNLLRSQTSGGL